jgi:hypothetical protein
VSDLAIARFKPSAEVLVVLVTSQTDQNRRLYYLQAPYDISDPSWRFSNLSHQQSRGINAPQSLMGLFAAELIQR